MRFLQIFSFTLLTWIVPQTFADVIIPLVPRAGTFVGVSDDGGKFIRLKMGDDGFGTLKICEFTSSPEAPRQYSFRWKVAANEAVITDVHALAKTDDPISKVLVDYHYSYYAISVFRGETKIRAEVWDEKIWRLGTEMLKRPAASDGGTK